MIRTDIQKAKRRTPEERAKANAYAREWRKRPDNYERILASNRIRHQQRRDSYNAKRREQYATDPEYRARKRASHRKFLYGIATNEYALLLIEQNGLCAICKQPQSGRRKHLSVDHNHDTGEVRGLLCTNCNAAIGLLKENPLLFDNAKEYLLEHARVFGEEVNVPIWKQGNCIQNHESVRGS